MKKKYFILASFLLTIVTISFGQNREEFKKKYAPIQTELESWDPIRGKWLASSVEAMSFNEQIPDRPFPENFTPNQMMRMVPFATRSNIDRMTGEVQPNEQNVTQWNRVRRFSRISNCNSTARSGRSYGDPHLVSFDGERFSFQTVGEFVMVKSPSQNMEVQVRQRAQGDDFSLNSAVAMNVGGDRLCIYAKDFPDGDYSTPVRLNGLSLHLQGSTYFLPHGGTIRKSNRDYTVHFPSGEVVTVDVKRDFMNVNVQVSPCDVVDYNGLLGNANGSRSDDFNVRGMVSPPVAVFGRGNDDYFKKERQAYLAKDFADAHRITQMTSLFDYRIGTSTMYYTDRSFPRVYRDMSDLSQRQRDRARRACENSGIRGADMNGCIYDNAYLNIEPNRPTVVQDPTTGTVLRPITAAEPVNVNPTKPMPPKPNPKPTRLDSKGEAQSTGGAQGRTVGSTKPTETSTPKPVRTSPTRTSPTRTSPRPVVVPRPKPTPRPTVRTKPTPRPTPRPKPTPRPAPRPKAGKSIGGR